MRILLLLVALSSLAACDWLREGLPWQRFSIAGASMEPTLHKGTYVSGESVDLADLRRGDILFVKSRGDTYVTRLAGLPGDRVAVVDGQVILNGKPVRQRAAGTWKTTDFGGEREVARFSEHFPGERSRHYILDDGMTLGDNFPEVVIPEDRYFFLGDNRDHAADSRYGNDAFGLGLVSGKDIVRRLADDR